MFQKNYQTLLTNRQKWKDMRPKTFAKQIFIPVNVCPSKLKQRDERPKSCC